MQINTLYEFHEIVALFASTFLGTGAYLSFLSINQGVKIGWKFAVLTYFINLFFANIASELMQLAGWDGYRSFALPLIAYAGQYLAEYLDKKREKFFDAGAKKIGINIDDDEEETKQDTDDFQE